MSAEVDQNTVDKQCAEIERKNLLIANENLIDNCLSNQLMFVVEQSRCLDLEAPYNANDVTDLLEQNERLRAEIEKVKQHYKEISVKKNKVLAPGMYAIDVKPIPHPLKNNRSAHLNYINHLKESVETVREIVEEARVVKPLDNALNYACQYTKLSQGID
ncbi:hypothetical protein Tco_0409701 [Tanacetum coccineum]